jgi:Trk K+ transport system NAD-binding subunit
MQIAILGAGMVGRAMAIDLSKKYQVSSFDLSKESLQILSNKNKSITTVQADLSDYASYPALLAKFDYVITDYDYIIQYAMYKMIAKRHFNNKTIIFRFVFCSKEEPYNIAFITLNDEIDDLSSELLLKLIRDFRTCAKTGIYYDSQIQERNAKIPEYRLKKYFDYINNVGVNDEQ